MITTFYFELYTPPISPRYMRHRRQACSIFAHVLASDTYTRELSYVVFSSLMVTR